jgi:PKD repeat protein
METREVIVYKPNLVLSPSSGKGGTQVTVTGNSFNLYAIEFPQGTITFNGVVVVSNFWFTRTGSLGSFTTSFTVPSGTAPGSYTVRATGPLDSADTLFTITNIAPQALIDANPLSGKTPLPVHFSGTRSYDEDGSISSYRWDFGDGTSATGTQVDHTYNRSGDYRATLTVTDNQGKSGTAAITIRVDNSPPVADARADRTSGSDPLTVNFDGSQSKDPDGRIVSYQWNFGDGYSEKTAIASHQYRNPQSYTAVLTVTDDKGMTDTDEIVITVGNEPPVAAITFSPQEGTEPLTVQLDGSQSHDPDDTDLTFLWDFGDGVYGNGMTAGHTYEEKGTYQLSLLVTDPHGASNKAVATVEVKPSVPWIEVFFIVVGFIAVAVITWHYIHKQPKRKFPEPEVNIDVKSGVEYPAGLEGENRELPDISVEVRSGIWKEGEKR